MEDSTVVSIISSPGQSTPVTDCIRIQTHPLYPAMKRVFDVMIAALMLIACSPLMLCIIILIRIDSPGSALFRHWRVGKNGKHIGIYKFRTMVSDANNFEKYLTKKQMEHFLLNYKLDADPRITRIGKILRKTSLDELPQLVNILVGDMSLVGPRPLVERELEDYYGPLAQKFCSILPGLTGYWQANGRNDMTYEQRVSMELYYIENRSALLDFKILLKTFICIISKRGAK